MSSTSRRQAIQNVIAAALVTASPVSLIDVALAQSSTITVKTKDGKEVSITSQGKTASSTAAIVSGTRVVDAHPSGTFVLANGKTIKIEKGLLVGGTAAQAERDWMAFALLPAESGSRPEYRPAEPGAKAPAPGLR